jgi:hypothetical protein
MVIALLDDPANIPHGAPRWEFSLEMIAANLGVKAAGK